MHSAMIQASVDTNWDATMESQTNIVKDKAKKIKNILRDDKHWRNLKEIVNYLEPIYSLFRIQIRVAL